MTYRELCERLQRGGVEDAAYEAQRLLEHFCGASPLSLRAEPTRSYASDALDGALARRLAHEPLQYILGEWCFYRQTYEVSPHCLIPRSDTEILVEEAIRQLPRGARFADLCTGSGCIAISVLCERPDTTAHAFEKFPDTLRVAIRNAEKNGVADRLTPVPCDVLLPPEQALKGCFDAVLSNPPYIATDVLPSLSPEVHREPRAALDGGADGLTFYRAILTHWSSLLRPRGLLLLEIGYDQGDAVCALGRACGFTDVRVLRDLGGMDRVISMTKK